MKEILPERNPENASADFSGLEKNVKYVNLKNILFSPFIGGILGI